MTTKIERRPTRCSRRQQVELVEHRGDAQLVDAGERQLHLRLRARDLHDGEPRSLVGGVPDKRRLPDPRFAADDENGTLPLPHARQQPVEACTLVDPVEESGRERHCG